MVRKKFNLIQNGRDTLAILITNKSCIHRDVQS